MYEKIGGPDEYLNSINNGLIKFIGFYVDLMKVKDKEGMKLWKTLDKEMLTDKIVVKEKITELLNNVPLYFLMSFMGYAYHRYNRDK